MAEPLESCRLKLARADHHFTGLHARILKLGRDYPHRLTDEIDSQTGEKVWRYSGDPPAPPADIHPFIGDVLYNLRSALDHLAWQLVRVAGGATTPRIAFPLFDTADGYGKHALGKMKGMDAKAIAEIERLQPYHGADARQIRLGWLDCLGNIDKHRHFNLTIAAMAGGMWSRALPISHLDAFIHVGPVEDGTELARVPAEHSDVDFLPVFDVAFGHAGPAAGESVTMTLLELRADLKVVLTRFARLFFS